MGDPVSIIGGFYADDSLPWSAQDCVNWLPVKSESPDTRTGEMLRGVPGFVDLSTVGVGPIRGMHNAEGALFVVSGTSLYSVSLAGVGTSHGTIPGTARVSMAHNQITGGNEVLVVNGDAGYVWNTVTSVFAKITDAGYPGAFVAHYIDSYLAQVEPFGRFWFHSNLAAATDYNTLDRYESEASPDKIQTLHVNHLEIVIFNETTIEFFDNTGAATNTFASKRIVIERGCAGRHTVANIDNSLIFLGNDGVVYRIDGYQAVPISTRPIEKAIAANNWAQAYAFTWEDEGHKVYYLTFPDGKTWGYDVVSGLWHRRASFGLEQWRLADLVFWNGQWVGGDYSSGKLYTLSWAAYDESGADLIAERTSGVLHSNQQRIVIPGVELVMDTGNASTSIDSIVQMCYSDDGARNYKNWKQRSLGAVGQYGKRVRFLQLGETRHRVWKIRVSSRCKRDLLGAVLTAEGTSG